MDDRQALLLATVANPDEDTPRLALADWLEEHGDAHDRARAEYIRLQCQIAHVKESSPSPPTIQLLAWAEDLHRQHARAWMGPLWEMTGDGYRAREFDRGLLRWWYTTAGGFLKKSQQTVLCEWFPRLGVATLMLTEKSARAKHVAQSPALGWASCLSWRRSQLNDEALQALAASPHASRISVLDIDHPHCTDSGLEALAVSTCWPNLQRLGLSDGHRGGRYTHAGVLAVLNSPHFPHLGELNLSGTQPDAFENAAFYDNEGLRRLRQLWRGPDVRMRDFASCAHFTALEEVFAAEISLDDETAEILLANPAFVRLQKVTFYAINPRLRPLSPAVEQKLRDRFGTGLKLTYSILSLRS